LRPFGLSCLWLDFDAEGAADAAQVKLAQIDFLPTFWVRTGTAPYERWHAWWLLSDALTGTDAEATMRRMIAALDADPERLCKKLDEYREAASLLLDAESEVCRTCEHRASCRVLTDKLVKADVYIVAHQALAGKPPHERAGPPAWWRKEQTEGKGKRPREGQHLLFTVVDEDPTGALMFGADLPRVVGLDAWSRAPDAEDEELKAARKWLGRVVESNGLGPLKRSALIPKNTGTLDADTVMNLAIGGGKAHTDAGAKLEWHRKVAKGEGADQLAHNKTVRTRHQHKEPKKWMNTSQKICAKPPAPGCRTMPMPPPGPQA